ncbi:hypothetical protein [Mucilaginibacter sp.]|uniref:hypothetical protein n=1 Tax=Mucilaginibacter sp. TaxID=1882438 RepID=UPI0035BBDC5B
MKKLLLLLLMIFAVGAFAQTRKKHAAKKKARHSVRHRSAGGSARMEEAVEKEEKTAYPFISLDSVTKKLTLKDPPNDSDRPYVLVNNNPYYGRLQDLNPKSFTDISVIKSKGAKMIYGQKAAAGALIIETKQVLPAGQPANVLLPMPKGQPSSKPFILNEEPASGKLTDIDPDKILKIDTLIAPKFAGAKENDTTFSVTTKVYGKKLYQWKFGTLSKAYKTYIRGRRGKDSGVNYILNNGTILTGGNEEDLIRLLEVYNSDIKTVTFSGPGGTGKNRKPATVNIELNLPEN